MSETLRQQIEALLSNESELARIGEMSYDQRFGYNRALFDVLALLVKPAAPCERKYVECSADDGPWETWCAACKATYPMKAEEVLSSEALTCGLCLRTVAALAPGRTICENCAHFPLD